MNITFGDMAEGLASLREKYGLYSNFSEQEILEEAIKNKNKDKGVKIIIEKERVIIEGLKFVPYWRRILLAICWWKNPKFIINSKEIVWIGWENK